MKLQFKKFFLSAIPLIFVLAPCTHASEPEKLVFKEAGFSIAFPSNYHEMPMDKADTFKKRILVAGDEKQGAVYSLIFAGINSKKMSPEQILSAMTQPPANSPPELIQKTLTLPKYLGKELIMPLRPAMGVGGVFKWYRKRVILTYDTLYQIELFADTREKLTSKVSNSFFESFKTSDASVTNRGNGS